jgi:hypothetical protein
MGLARPEFSLNPPALADRVVFPVRVVGCGKLPQDVVQQGADRVDQEVLDRAEFRSSVAFRFRFVVNRAAFPDVSLDHVNVDDDLGDVTELIECQPLEESAHSLNSHTWFSGTRFIGRVR